MKLPACAILLFLLSVAGAFAQLQRPGGFADIPWRTKVGEAKHAMQSKPGIQGGGGNNASHLIFQGGTFAGKPAVVWGLEFVDDGFYRGAVVLKAFGERPREFEAIKTLLIQKYGQPTTTSKKGKDVKALWKFPSDAKNKDAEIIVLWNNPNEGGVKITYRNESMRTGDASDGL